jgi:ammonium transporter, Amt family
MNSTNSDAIVKVLDFAGGTVVHVNAGVAGLMCALMLGKRKDTAPAHNMVLTFIGVSLLWVGWFGFNAGSAVQAGMAMTVTQIATAAAALAWMFVEWALRGKPISAPAPSPASSPSRRHRASAPSQHSPNGL